MGMLNQFNRCTGVSCWSSLICVALLWGCGGGDSESSGNDQTQETDQAQNTGDGVDDSTDETGTEDTTDTTDETGTEDTTDTTDTTGETGTDETANCEDTLVITFDLTGSRFRVDPKSGLAQTAEEEIGPGSMKLRFVAENGVAQAGRVTVLDYANTLAFSISDVDTAMETFAGPDECGVATGSLAATNVDWVTSLQDYTSEGTVTCNAGSLICGIIGMEEGVAEERNTIQDLDLNGFIFDADLESFEMDWVQVTDDDHATTYLTLTGVRSTKADEQPVCEVAPTCP